MKLPFTLHHASLKGCQGEQGCHAPLKIPGQVFLFTFCLREGGVGGKRHGERGKKRPGLLGKTMTLKKLKPVLKAVEECDLSRETQASNGTVPLQQTNADHAKMHCQCMWSLQVALRLPTTQYWHGDTILDCAGGSSQSKRSLKIEGGWMERRPAR